MRDHTESKLGVRWSAGRDLGFQKLLDPVTPTSAFTAFQHHLSIPILLLSKDPSHEDHPEIMKGLSHGHQGTGKTNCIQGKPNISRKVSNRLFQFTFSSKSHLAAAKSLQSCPTLCDPIDGRPPGFSVHGIFQARVLEWAAITFSKMYATVLLIIVSMLYITFPGTIITELVPFDLHFAHALSVSGDHQSGL